MHVGSMSDGARKGSAWCVEVELTRGAVEGEAGPLFATRVAGEGACRVGGCGEEG